MLLDNKLNDSCINESMENGKNKIVKIFSVSLNKIRSEKYYQLVTLIQKQVFSIV